MTVIGFHASHEQISPGQLLIDVQHAERAGFEAAMCSDHFAPWSDRQGESGHPWTWLGAAMATTSLPFGVVNAPGQRYHPTLIAQASATLAQMFPGRFWAALGTGEFLNEHITGERWPSKEQRTERLRECVDVIRRLHAGDRFTHEGHVKVHDAQLYTLPDPAPALIGAATSVETAQWCAEWADGLVTVGIEPEDVAEVRRAYVDAGGSGPVILQLHLSYATAADQALAIAHDQWRTNVFSSALTWDLWTVEQFDEAARFVKPEHVHGAVRVSADLDQHTAWVREYAEVGFDQIMLHHVGKEQAEFIDAFGEHVLPQLEVNAS